MPPPPPHKTSTLGVLGLGIIGSRVAAKLNHNGNKVWVWNRTPKPFPCFLGSPAEVARHAETLLFFLKDGPALLETLRAMSGGLTPGHLVVSHCTCSPQETREAASIADLSGAKFLEAPFTGSRDAAEAGELVYYIGGEAALLERARPILEQSAKRILHLGGLGDASLIKVATNMISAATVAAAAEALALVAASGLPGEKFLDAVGANAVDSATLKMKLPAMLRGDFEPRFSLANMAKDMAIAKSLLDAAGIPAGQVRAFLEQASATAQLGLADRDFSAIYRSLLPEGAPPDRPV